MINELDLQHLSSNEVKDAMKKILEEVEKYHFSRSDYILGNYGNYGELCLVYEKPFWAVCSTEKGVKNYSGFFTNFFDAGNFLIWELMRRNKKMFSYHPSIPFQIL